MSSGFDLLLATYKVRSILSSVNQLHNNIGTN